MYILLGTMYFTFHRRDIILHSNIQVCPMYILKKFKNVALMTNKLSDTFQYL